MADNKATKPVEASPTVEETPAAAPAVSKEEAPAAAPEAKAEKPAEDAAPAAEKDVPEETTKALAKVELDDKPAEPVDTEMKDAEPSQPDAGEEAGVVPPPAVEEAAAPAGDDTATPAKSSAARRKSTGGPSLKKKASKARITHLDAKAGDYYFVKLKGSSPWPAIIADEEILTPEALKRRPVSAVRTDGTYREDYDDGGKRVHERRFPVMYLATNDFQWVPNTDLVELDFEAIKEVKTDKMKKDLRKAYELAIEQHTLDHYKQELKEFEEDLKQQEELAASKAEKAAQAAAAKAAKAVETPAKKGKKSKAKVDEEEDVDMIDADEEGSESAGKKSTKKRKAEGSAETPQRSDSVKRPKIKLTTSSTPKTNGAASTPKPAKAAGESKSAKPKAKKADEAPVEKEMSVPKEPEVSAEDLHKRKEKEVLFLRHKLQKGLLTRDQDPKEEEMKTMSDYISKLENMPDLEVSIIRATKINKVLKAIIKMDSIPKEDDFKFKTRSHTLLEEWNKTLAADEPANGVNGAASEAKAKQTAGTNGTKEKTDATPEVEKETEKKAEKEIEKEVEEEADKEAEKEAPKDNEKEAEKEAPKDNEKSEEATASADEQPAASEEAKESEAVLAAA